jgi:NAD(P)-dependent dehydrogenase (short-subunit alcohol dehydrogenase family)
MDTPMVRGIGGKMAAAGLMREAANAPPPPPVVLGSAEDIAWMVVFLASDESRFVSGQKLVVDNTVTVTPGVVAHRASAA